MGADRARFVTLEVVEAKLTSLGCKREPSPIPQQQLWCTSWGFRFFVPEMLRATLNERDYLEILGEIEESRPAPK